jgi:hypothetical protein
MLRIPHAQRWQYHRRIWLCRVGTTISPPTAGSFSRIGRQNMILRLTPKRVRVMLLILAVILITVLVVRTLILTAREAARRALCRGRLSAIALALRNYHHDYGNYPPLYIRRTDGKPAHSWRVLLLPYLGREDIYQQYRFDEPWNGPHNQNLAASIPKDTLACFQCPSDCLSQFEWTSYLAVAPPEANRRVDSEISNPSGTQQFAFAVLEAQRSGVHWMEPRDLTLDGATGVIGTSPHRGEVNFITADGVVGTLRRSSVVFCNDEHSLIQTWLSPIPLK